MIFSKNYSSRRKVLLQENIWKESPRLNNNIVGHQTLAEEFCLVNREFSDLQCLMNILLTAAEDVKVLLMRFLL